MKKQPILIRLNLILFTSLIFTGCSSDKGLSGEWVGQYQCPNVQGDIAEQVKIVQDKDFYIKATKITGDDCVLAGQVSFEGRISQPIKCIGGWPDKPSTASFESMIEITDANNFKVCNVEFKRK